MQYLVTMDFVDPGPLLPMQQYAKEAGPVDKAKDRMSGQ